MPGASVHVHSALLSAVAGYVDAAGFASLIGLFPAHLTGELVGDAVAVTSGHLGEHATRLWMLPVFVGSVATATLVARMLRRSGQRPLAGLLTLVTGALALFSASDYLAGQLKESWHLHVILGGACAVAAMGFQNALMRESLAGSCPTTVMTGNMTQVVVAIVDRLFIRFTAFHHRDRRSPTRMLPVLSALLSFMGCAILGGFLTRYFGSLSVMLPTALTAALTVQAFRQDRRAKAREDVAAPLRQAPLPRFDVWPELAPGRELPESSDSGHGATKRTISGTQLKAQSVDSGLMPEASTAGARKRARGTQRS